MKNIVIFGASGALARERLYPALFDLFLNGLPFKKYLGYGRTKFAREEFIELVKKSILEKKKGNPERLNSFLDNFNYVSGGYDGGGLENLKSQLSGPETIYYFSLPTTHELIKNILSGLKVSGLIDEPARVVLEKPFGSDLASATRLNDLMLNYLNERQIFRIDHYLAKDLVRDLLTLRFTNSIFGPLWNNKFIESINIQIKETDCIEDRGEFYEQTGAIRDVIQNHALELLALTMMDQPRDLTPKAIRDEKRKILKKLRLFKNKGLENIAIGQYRDYRNKKHVRKDSLTETSASIAAEVNSAAWRGVPVTLLTGKRLDEKSTDIIIKFRRPLKHPWKNNGCRIENNQLIINIQPHNDIKLKLNFGFEAAKKCSLPIDLRFGFLDNQFMFKDAYENALKDLYNDDQSIFLGSKEILLAWKFIDKAMALVNKNREKLLKFY